MRTVARLCLTLLLLTLPLAAWAANSEYLDLSGWSEPNTPADHNKLGILRYSPEGKTATVAAIFVPGNGGGASSFDIIGRWLADNAGIEVWAMDRRSNQFEDHTGTEMAKKGDIAAALRYYTGPAYKPLDPTAVPYMKYWGLRTHLNDIHTIVERIRARGIKDIFLGGHSLGAIITQAYAAYELPDGAPAYKDVRGLILFDGSFGTPRTSADADKRIADMEREINEGRVFAPEGGRTGPITNLIALAAANDPDGISILAPLVPPRTGVTLPIANLALFGVAMDTDYRSNALCRCGKLADVDPSNPGAPRGWISYDKCGEVTDALALAKGVIAGHGGGEWYQPAALRLEIGKAGRTMLDAPDLGFKYQKVMDLPVIAFLANAEGYQFADGMKSYAAGIKGKSDIHNIDPPGFYAHLDPLVAADADRRVFTPLKEWMEQVVAGGQAPK